MSSDDTTVTMLSKYNLYVGGDFQNNVWTKYGSLETGVQNSSMLGWVYGQSIRKGVTSYSKTNYWYDGSQLKDNYGTSYPSYVYDNNSSLYSYIENYRIYLESQGVTIQDARLINMLELETLGCSKIDYSCSNALSWVKNTSYWSGEAFNSQNMWCVGSGGAFGRDIFSNVEELGVRPIIVISKEYF